ncbi:MAG: hypothetical protein EHM45_12715 [Desulfobacteraceae bacterium]|nr:MAG: hypothetical protein EHM45_12715 [Desulfobacteraceae bacterium]
MEENEKVRTKAVILTPQYRIIGNISLLPGARLTDYMREAKSFIAITDAEVTDLSGKPVLSADFIDVQLRHIHLIAPYELITLKT